MRAFSCLICLVHLICVSSILPAQGSGGTAPRRLTANWGDGSEELPLGRTQSRWHQVYEATALPRSLTTGRAILSVGFRRAANSQIYNPDQLTLEISAYSVPFGAAGMSTTFAQNRAAGTGGLVFVQKQVSTPAVVFGNPRDAYLTIPLDVPHLFNGPNLLIETVTFDAAPVRSTGWLVDYGIDGATGSTAIWGFPCGARKPQITSTSSGGQYLPGSTLNVGLSGASWSALGICAFGVVASGVYPIDLTPLGLPGCAMYFGPLVTVSVPLSVLGAGQTSLQVPNNPQLSGNPVYAQWYIFDPNNFGPLGTSEALMVRIGPRTGNDGANTFRFNDNLDTTGGAVATGRLPATRLGY